MMEKFKEEIESVIAKYPEIGDVTISIKRTVSIDVGNTKKAEPNGSLCIPGFKNADTLMKDEKEPYSNTIMNLESNVSAKLKGIQNATIE